MGAEIPDGAFLVARAIFNSSLWTMGKEDRLLAVTCIGLANWKSRKIWIDGKEVEIKRGQFLRSLTQLKEAAKLSLKEVRTSLNHLIRARFLARERAGHSFIYTVCKYEKYQDLTKYADSEWPEAAQKRAQDRAQGGHSAGTRRAGDGQVTGNKQEGDIRDQLEKGEECKADRAQADVLGLLMHRAADAKIPNHPETIRRYLAAWIARKGGAEVERILMLPAVQGLNVLQIDKGFFGGDKPGGMSDEERARQLAREMDERMRRAD